MIRLACLSFYPAAGPSVRHRISGYTEAWGGMGIELSLLAFLTGGLYANRRRFGWHWTLYKAFHFAFCTARLAWRVARLRRFDLVIIHREAFPLGGAWFERIAARINPRIVFDFDDAIWLPMPLAVNQRQRFWDPERVGATMSACAAVVAGNAYLADYARKFNPKVSIIPTPFLDFGGGGIADRAGDRPVVVWIGNVGNEEYLDFLRVPMQRLAREFDFVFRVIGSAEAAGFQIPGVTVEVLVWTEERERAWLLESAVGVMPLHDREYERGKCSFKLIQYFSAGLPVIASPVGMNTDVVAHGVNGYLASDAEQWYLALRSLLADPQMRRRMGACGYQTFRERFTRETNAHLWASVLHEVLATHPGRTG